MMPRQKIITNTTPSPSIARALRASVSRSKTHRRRIKASAAGAEIVANSRMNISQMPTPRSKPISQTDSVGSVKGTTA